VVGGGAKLWDQPAALFDGLETFENPSWYYTERVVQGLISTANLLSEEPIVNERLVVRTFDMLYEAEHLYDMERMRGSADGSPGVENVLTEIRIKLARARDIARSRPAAAGALVTSALASLDALDAVRSDGSPAL
jgi:hypothetical protein